MIRLPPQAIYAAAGLAVLAFVYWKGRKVLAATATAVNPLNRDNVFYSGANALGAALSSTVDDRPFGVKLYDWTHPNEPFTR